MEEDHPLPSVVHSIKLEQVDVPGELDNDYPISDSTPSSSESNTNNSTKDNFSCGGTSSDNDLNCRTADSGGVADVDDSMIKAEPPEKVHHHHHHHHQHNHQQRNELEEGGEQEETFTIPRKMKPTPTPTASVVEAQRKTTNSQESPHLHLYHLEHPGDDVGKPCKQVALESSQEKNFAVNGKKNQSVRAEENARGAFQKRLDEIMPQLPQELKAQFGMICFAENPAKGGHPTPARVLSPYRLFTMKKGIKRLKVWLSRYDEIMKSHRRLIEMPRLVYFYGYQIYEFLSEGKTIVPYEEGLKRGLHNLAGLSKKKRKKNKEGMTVAIKELEDDLRKGAAAARTSDENEALGLESNHFPPHDGSPDLRVHQLHQQEHPTNGVGQQREQVAPVNSQEKNCAGGVKNQSVKVDENVREAFQKRLDEIVPQLPQELKAQFGMMCFAENPAQGSCRLPARVLSPYNLLAVERATKKLRKWLSTYDEIMKSHGRLIEMPRLVYFYKYHNYECVSNNVIVPYEEGLKRGIHSLRGDTKRARKRKEDMQKAIKELENDLQKISTARAHSTNDSLGLEGSPCPSRDGNARVGFTANVSQGDIEKHRFDISNRAGEIANGKKPPCDSSSSCKKRKSRETMDGERDEGDEAVNRPSNESRRARCDNDRFEQQPKVAKRRETEATHSETSDSENARASKGPAFWPTEAEKQLVLNSAIRDAKVEFENKKKKVLAELAGAYKSRFGKIGFAAVSTGNSSQSWMPVLVMDPYGVPPGGVRHQWLTMFENLNELNRLHDLPILVYWYGTEGKEDCYGFVPCMSFVSYSEGVQKGYDKVARDGGDDDNNDDDDDALRIEKRRKALEEMREDACKDASERKRGRHDFLEGYQLLSVAIFK